MPWDDWSDHESGAVQLKDSASGKSVLLPPTGAVLLETKRIDLEKKAAADQKAADATPAIPEEKKGGVPEDLVFRPAAGPALPPAPSLEGRGALAQSNAQIMQGNIPQPGAGGAPQSVADVGPNYSVAPGPAAMSGASGGAPGAAPNPPGANTDTGANGASGGDYQGPDGSAPGAGPGVVVPVAGAGAPASPGGRQWKPSDNTGPPGPNDFGDAADMYRRAAQAPGGGTYKIKGGKFQTGEHVESQGMLDPDTLANQGINIKLARQAEANRVQEENSAAADVEQRRQWAAEKHDEAIAHAEQIGQQQADTARSAYQAKVQEVADIGFDPNRWYKSRTTAQQAAGGIGMILAGFADAFNARARAYGHGGTDRSAVQDMVGHFNQAAEADIHQQLTTRQNAKEAASDLGKIYQDTLATTHDKLVAMNSAKAANLELVAKAAMAKAQEAGSPLAEARATEFAAKAQVEVDRLNAENAQRLKVSQAFQVTQDRQGGAGLSLEKRAALMEKAGEARAKGGEGTDSPRGDVVFGDQRVHLDPRLSGEEAALIRRGALASNNGIKEVANLREMRAAGKLSHKDAITHGADRLGYWDALSTWQGQATADQIKSARAKWATYIDLHGLDAAESAFLRDQETLKEQYARPPGVRNPKK